MQSTRHRLHPSLLVGLALLAALAACQRQAPSTETASTPASAPEQAVPAAPAPEPLKDVIERDPRYLVGISYPPGIDKYPGLAAELRAYADKARADLQQALAALGNNKPTVPYDLTLSFTTLTETPGIVAVAADGSSYTGGAHGNPLVARFVWIPQHGKPLRITDLIADAGGWRDLSDTVREQLRAALSQRIDADDMPPAERAALMKTAFKMIDAGTSPEPSSFAQFEPVLGADGKMVALRFVFPPYQVGPYSDGVQTVEVPAAALLPHIVKPYRELFATGQGSPVQVP